MTRLPALGNRDFLRLWAGQFASNIGTWMQNVAQSWLVWKLTGNEPLYLGLLGACFALPMVLFPTVGGAIADRVNRVRLLFVTQSAQLALAAGLAVLAWSGVLRPWHILSTTFAGATLLAFDNPCRQALIAELVEPAELPSALSLNAATFTGAALAGPALAGVLLPSVGAGWLFLLDAISFVAVIVALARLDRRAPRHAPSVNLDDALFGGIRYVAREPRLAALLLLAAVAAICGRSYPQLLPMFADGVWQGGSVGYGLLLAASGMGALAGAFGLSWRGEVARRDRAAVGAGALFALLLAGFAYAPRLGVGILLLIPTGAAATVFTTLIATSIQLEVPGALRGRVMGLYAITLIGLPALGSLGASLLARRIGAPRALVLGAAATLLALLSTAARARRAT